ncbi:hypothetical protein BAU22_16775 [Bacillus sp. 4048]|uniref:hypothetical protein n=1 Tax=Bacillus TaxID=1386 RepID=UPI0008FEA9DA|nr:MULTISPECIES: hypothetical protein [Bacillus]OJD46177.1 hypothetical protein BAU22_16775 [Bacillus sp. 4048]TCD27545.1 hypothetical protein E0D84_28790 [Bacillus wiedmannii]
MSRTENILTNDEINCLDVILSDVNLTALKDYSIDMKVFEQRLGKGEDINSLRSKGVFDIEELESFEQKYSDEDAEPILKPVNVSLVKVNVKKLIMIWLNTVFYNAGRAFSLERDTKIEYENGEYSVLIENGIQEAPKIIFLTKRLNDSKLFQNIEGKVYIAFFASSSIPEERMSHWDIPLSSVEEATRFFAWLQESNKETYSKLYNYINIPKDLDNSQIEGILLLVNDYLIEMDYQKTNDSRKFRQESIEYLIPYELIREVFISTNGNKKIIIIVNNNRIEIHSFINGVKKINEELETYIQSLDSWINGKVKKHRSIQKSIKTPMLSDIKQYIGIFLMIIVPAITSFMLLFQGVKNIEDIFKDPIMLTIHVLLSVVIIIIIFYLSIVPHIKLRWFSWERGIKRVAEKDKSKLNL